MTFIPKQQEKNCFIACSEDKLNAGLCDCINRMKNQAFRQPSVIGSVCPCGRCLDEVDIQFKQCYECGRYWGQTDL